MGCWEGNRRGPNRHQRSSWLRRAVLDGGAESGCSNARAPEKGGLAQACRHWCLSRTGRPIELLFGLRRSAQG